jgi:RNA polymerase sigma-70 factor, ECF subfamily
MATAGEQHQMYFLAAIAMPTAETTDWQREIKNQYDQYGPALRRRCERVLRNTQDAEDIVQELFTDIWKKKRGDFDFPYLYSAVTNRCITLLRTRNRHSGLLQNKHVTDIPQALLPDDSVINQQLIHDVATRLDKTTAAIFLYRYIDEMTQEEIAEVMGISRKTIGRRLARLDENLARYSHRHHVTLQKEMGERDER